MMAGVEAVSAIEAESEGMVEIVMVRETTAGRLQTSLRLVLEMVRSDPVTRRSGRAS